MFFPSRLSPLKRQSLAVGGFSEDAVRGVAAPELVPGSIGRPRGDAQNRFQVRFQPGLNALREPAHFVAKIELKRVESRATDRLPIHAGE